MAQSAKRKGDWTVAQLDIMRLAHDSFGVRDGEVREAAMIFFEAVRALCIGLTRHLSAEISKLLVELLDLVFGLKMLEGAADGCIGESHGDGAESAGIKFRMSLKDVE